MSDVTSSTASPGKNSSSWQDLVAEVETKLNKSLQKEQNLKNIAQAKKLKSVQTELYRQAQLSQKKETLIILQKQLIVKVSKELHASKTRIEDLTIRLSLYGEQRLRLIDIYNSYNSSIKQTFK